MLSLALAAPAFAQSQAANGSIEGTVTDSSGGVLPGVTVTVTNLDTGAERAWSPTKKDCIARRCCRSAPTGSSAELQGFKRFEQTGIKLSVGQTAVVNATLARRRGQRDDHGDRATARCSIPARIDIGHTMTDLEVHNLPLVARNPVQLRARAARRHRHRATSSSACRAWPPTAPRCASTIRSTATPTPRRIAPACGCCRCRK